MLDVLLGIPNWLLALITVALLVLYMVWHYTQLQRLGYKCPVPWPIFGHWHIIMQQGYRSDSIHKDQYGKVFAQYEGLRPSIVLCDPKIIKECTITKFSDYPQRIVPFPVSKEVEYAVTTALGTEWKRQRNIMTRAFSAAKMRKLTILINSCARQFCGSLNEKVERNENIEVRKTCGEFVMRVVATSLFGIDVSKDEELGKFARYAVKMSASLDLKNPVMFLSLLSRKITPIFKAMGYGYKRRGYVITTSKLGFRPVAIECFHFFKRTMIALKKSREQLDEYSKPNDLLQLLLDGHKGDDIARKASVMASAFDATDESLSVASDVGDNAKLGFSTDEIVSNAIIFFSAGYITTTAALGWMMYLLATHLEVQDKLLKEVEEFWPQDPDETDLPYDTIAKMTYLDQVFCETLRVFPSTQRMDRISVRNSTLGGRPVPKGVQVNISIWSVHHDEDYWPDPFKFDPERFSPENKDKIEPYSFIPFGSGPRNCIGMRLATLEAKVAISHLVKRYHLLPCADTEIPPNLRNQVHTAPTAGIVLKLEPRK